MKKHHSASRSNQRGFSLMEVVLAMGLVSFVMMTIVGLLPVGLQMAQDSRLQQAKANIVQQMRGMLQQISFDEDSGQNSGQDPDQDKKFTIHGLPKTFLHFSEDGMKTEEANAFYEASFELDDASVKASQGSKATKFGSTNARFIIVTLEYPMYAPESARKSTVFSLLSANQGTP